MHPLTGSGTPRGISAVTLFVFGGGLALYQMTALVLGGPSATRQLDISLNVPSITSDDLSVPLETGFHLVLGTLAPVPVAKAPSTPTLHRSTTRARVMAPVRVVHPAPVVSAPITATPTVTTPLAPTPVVPPRVLPTPVSPWPVDKDGYPSPDPIRAGARD
jgi:hypothetical protein